MPSTDQRRRKFSNLLSFDLVPTAGYASGMDENDTDSQPWPPSDDRPEHWQQPDEAPEEDGAAEHFACPMCDGPAGPLGTLGSLEHFACRACGWIFAAE